MNHDWQRTGKVEIHVEAGKRRARKVHYVRYTKCKKVGFQFDGSKVTYTWEDKK
jgi:predicted Zn-ribbon and HTH transcriptional regulator